MTDLNSTLKFFCGTKLDTKKIFRGPQLDTNMSFRVPKLNTYKIFCGPKLDSNKNFRGTKLNSNKTLRRQNLDASRVHCYSFMNTLLCLKSHLLKSYYLKNKSSRPVWLINMHVYYCEDTVFKSIFAFTKHYINDLWRSFYKKNIWIIRSLTCLLMVHLFPLI